MTYNFDDFFLLFPPREIFRATWITSARCLHEHVPPATIIKLFLFERKKERKRNDFQKAQPPHREREREDSRVVNYVSRSDRTLLVPLRHSRYRTRCKLGKLTKKLALFSNHGYISKRGRGEGSFLKHLRDIRKGGIKTRLKYAEWRVVGVHFLYRLSLAALLKRILIPRNLCSAHFFFKIGPLLRLLKCSPSSPLPRCIVYTFLTLYSHSPSHFSLFIFVDFWKRKNWRWGGCKTM